MAAHGYSGNSFDRWINEQSLQGSENAMNKMQHQFWVAKQTILRRLGKKEDDCVVASDAELDAKLELFLSIQETCSQLDKIVEQYQERLQVLAQEESAMGNFLRTNGEQDKTQAGKMMNSVGKAMIYTARQRSTLKAPLARLHQEVETFCLRAVEDSSFTVNEMEKSRNDYRGALLWMKNVSQELDPDTFKQLEKFRRVQNHVRSSKTKFDRHKLACLQKIDLLAAARCNMFSHGLIVYQDNMANFWQRTSHALTTVSEAYEGYQSYEFTFVKELKDSSSKTAKNPASEPKFEFLFENEFTDEVSSPENRVRENETSRMGSSEKDKSKSKTTKEKTQKEPAKETFTADLIGLDLSRPDDSDALLLELASLDLGKDQASSLLSGVPEMPNISDPNQEEFSEFQANFEQVFGSQKGADDWNNFLPSQLLTSSFLGNVESPSSTLNCAPSTPSTPSTNAGVNASLKDVFQKKTDTSKKGKEKDMASWYNLFADLDPLGNPDALGNKKEDDDRNC